MGNQQDNPFRPLPPQRADELEYVIDQTGNGHDAMLINPDTGITGAKPVNLISPTEGASGVVNYGRHYLGNAN